MVQLFDMHESATITRLPKRVLAGLISAGHIAATMINGERFISYEEICRFEQAKTRIFAGRKVSSARAR